MAYLDIDNLYTTPGFADVSATTVPPVARGFSVLEWSVIALAKRDSLRSLGSPGRVARAMGGLFGMGTRSRLADPRLEALRRMAVLAWHRGFALPLREIDAFLDAGFAEPQLETLVESVTGMRIGG